MLYSGRILLQILGNGMESLFFCSSWKLIFKLLVPSLHILSLKGGNGRVRCGGAAAQRKLKKSRQGFH